LIERNLNLYRKVFMGEKWYDELSDDIFLKKDDKKYEEAIEKIKDAIKNGMGFDEACNSIDIKDAELKGTIVEDALKVLIADMHFTQKIPTDKVAEILKIPVERVNSARQSMLEEVKDASIKSFHKDIRIY